MSEELNMNAGNTYKAMPTSRANKLWLTTISPEVDAGFVEGGFYYSVVHKVCVKILRQRPLLPKTMPIFERF